MTGIRTVEGGVKESHQSRQSCRDVVYSRGPARLERRGPLLLIHPPVAKASEPPAGIARLAGALGRHGIGCVVLDANLEGLWASIRTPFAASDRWTQRAVRGVERNIATLSSWDGYRNIDRYKRAVADLNRVAGAAAAASGVHLTLADYQDPLRSAVRSADLLAAAEAPEADPFFGWFSRRLEEVLSVHGPSMVGFSLNYLSQALTAFAMAGFLRRLDGRLPIVFGGGLVTSWMRRPAFRNPFGGLIDTLVAGPGEGFLLESFGVEEPGAAGPPDFSVFSRYRYLSPGPILPYSASSGCYWGRCSFCPERAERNPYRPVPHTDVLTDLGVLSRAERPVLIHLLDNAVSPALLKRLAAGGGPGMPWYGFARASELLADEDFCRALKRSGCVMLKLGLESGDQDVLDAMGKGARVETAGRVLDGLRRAGIATYVYLLFGTPGEDRAAAERTLEFVVRHREAIGFLNLAVFNLPVHSPDARALATDPFYEADLSLYTGFAHPRGWDRPLVRRFLDREFRRHRAVAPILRRDPPLFTSNHAPLFSMAAAAEGQAQGRRR
nr:B12-binding domain-containing radical SAM protein [Desulfatiglans anilini]